DVFCGVTAGPQRLSGDGVEVQLGPPSAVEGAVGAPRRRGGGERKRSGATVRKRGGDEDRVGRIARQYRVFATTDRPGVCTSLRPAVEFGRAGPCTRFVVGEGQKQLACRHIIEDLLLLVGAQLGDQAAGDQRR